MNKFSSINQFRHVFQAIKRHSDRTNATKLPTMCFKGTLKLHGTNCGIRRIKGKIQPQTRTRIIDSSNDHFGFAYFVETLPNHVVHQLFDQISSELDDDITIYGEWVGKGIQKKIALSLLDKHWVIFAVKKNEEYIEWDIAEQPDYSIFSIKQCQHYLVDIDFNDPQPALDVIDQLVASIDSVCPWGARFGVEGVGEGIVWTSVLHPSYSDLWFKTKGQKHKQVRNDRGKVAIDPEKVESITQCVDLVLGIGRLEQGIEHLKENGLAIEMENIGQYFKWINTDVKKEEADVIQANKLSWKDVNKLVTQRAKEYFIAQVTKLY